MGERPSTFSSLSHLPPLRKHRISSSRPRPRAGFERQRSTMHVTLASTPYEMEHEVNRRNTTPKPGQISRRHQISDSKLQTITVPSLEPAVRPCRSSNLVNVEKTPEEHLGAGEVRGGSCTETTRETFLKLAQNLPSHTAHGYV